MKLPAHIHGLFDELKSLLPKATFPTPGDAHNAYTQYDPDKFAPVITHVLLAAERVREIEAKFLELRRAIDAAAAAFSRAPAVCTDEIDRRNGATPTLDSLRSLIETQMRVLPGRGLRYRELRMSEDFARALVAEISEVQIREQTPRILT